MKTNSPQNKTPQQKPIISAKSQTDEGTGSVDTSNSKIDKTRIALEIAHGSLFEVKPKTEQDLEKEFKCDICGRKISKEQIKMEKELGDDPCDCEQFEILIKKIKRAKLSGYKLAKKEIKDKITKLFFTDTDIPFGLEGECLNCDENYKKIKSLLEGLE